MAKITHEERSVFSGNYILVHADNAFAEIDIVIEDKENNDSMGVRLDKSQVEQLIDTLLYWVEKQ